MRIVSLECWKNELDLTEPYSIAYETIDKAPHVFLRLSTDAGFNGWGCAAPDLEVTGETADSVSESFQRVIEPALRGEDPFTYSRLLHNLKAELKSESSALAMVDMALHDLIGKKAGEPVYRLLGGFRECIATSVTIGIMPVDQTLKRTRDLFKKGFRILKIKGGLDQEEDIERVRKVREAVGDGVEIRFDANQGYSVDQALRFIHLTKEARIELLEQPTRKENEDLLKQISRQVSIPIMADESIMTLKDVFRLTSNDSTDMINIKLMKVGGIFEAMRINSVALAANVEAMVGCMDESAMGIAAGLHFALARPNILYADLDGHFDLASDPYASMVECREGILYPNSSPGFGWAE